MAEITADVFLSADGYAAGNGIGPYFDYGGPELDDWIASELARPQVILLGRRTYDIFARMGAEATDENSKRIGAHPKAVLSRTLTEPLAWANTRVLHHGLDELPLFKRTSPHPIRTMGSLMLVRSLLELGYLDRLRLMVFPLTLGAAGREHFWSGVSRAALGSATVEVLDERVVLLTYALPPGARSTLPHLADNTTPTVRANARRAM